MAKAGFNHWKRPVLAIFTLIASFSSAPVFAISLPTLQQQSAVIRESSRRQPTILRLGKDAALRIPHQALPLGSRVTLTSIRNTFEQEQDGWIPLGTSIEISGLDFLLAPPSRPILFRWKSSDATSTNHLRLALWNAEEQEWNFLPTSVVQAGFAVQAELPARDVTVLAFAPDPKNGPILDPRLRPPTLDSAAALVIDDETETVLFESQADEVRSIASITKLMSAMVFLDNFPGWDPLFTYSASDDRAGARLRITDGEQLTMKDLFYVTLAGSANNTAVALSRATPVHGEEFLRAMNQKASSLGLSATRFVDPSGLEVENVSTARDVAVMAREAFRDLRILQGTTIPAYAFETANTRISHRIKNTNPIRFDHLRVTGAKTGYIDEAGYCMVLKAQDAAGHEILVVVLGNPGSSDRFAETQALMSWAFSATTWMN